MRDKSGGYVIQRITDEMKVHVIPCNFLLENIIAVDADQRKLMGDILIIVIAGAVFSESPLTPVIGLVKHDDSAVGIV